MTRIGSIFFIVTLAISSCDTEKNIEPVNHFLKYYGDQGNQEAVDMVVGNDGSVYMLGNSRNSDSLYLVKADGQGNSLWEEKYGSATGLFAKDLEIDSNGDLLLLASTPESNLINFDFVVISADQESGVEISRVIDGYSGFDEQPYSITEISDGYLITGSTTKVKNLSSGDLMDGFIFRYDPAFNDYGVTWSNEAVQYGPGSIDVIVKAYEARPGYLYMFGYSNQSDILDQTSDYNFFVFSLNNEGVTNSLKFTPGEQGTNEILTSVKMISNTASAGFLLTGITELNGVAKLFSMRIVGDFESIKLADDLVLYQETITNFNFSTSTATTNAQETKAFGCPTSSGFLIVSSENENGNDNLYLTRLDNTLSLVDSNSPGLSFGGIGNDTAAAVSELPDGRILILGTMVLGEVNGQRKMVLMKVGADGRFSD